MTNKQSLASKIDTLLEDESVTDDRFIVQSVLLLSLASPELKRLQAENEKLKKDADRYQYLRSRDLNTISEGGIFAGSTPANLVINGSDLDCAIDTALAVREQLKSGCLALSLESQEGDK